MRSALAGHVAAVACGLGASAYVGVDVVEYVAPAVLGALVGTVAQNAAGPGGSQMMGRRTRVIGIVYALLGTAFGFVTEGTHPALSLNVQVVLGYAITAAAAWAWTMPPRREGLRQPGRASTSVGRCASTAGGSGSGHPPEEQHLGVGGGAAGAQDEGVDLACTGRRHQHDERRLALVRRVVHGQRHAGHVRGGE